MGVLTAGDYERSHIMVKRKVVDAAINDEITVEKEIDNDLTDEEKAEIDKVAKKIIELPSGVWKCELSEPLEYLDETYDELTFNFGKLKGEDVLNVEDELMRRHLPIYMNNTVNIYYIMLIAVRACEQNIDDAALQKLNAVDFNHIISKTKLFLSGIAV